MIGNLLKGVRVLDLSMVFAGPICSKILAELGAEVIKIESVPRYDVFTRTNVYPENQPGDDPLNRGSFFHVLNAGKYGISLNLGHEDGRRIFKQLVAISDVVIENFSPRVMNNLGLGYADLKKIKEDLIMVSMSGLGHDGPLKDFLMFVPGMEGMSGLTFITGHEDRPPLLSGFAYGDWMLGVTGAAGLLTALFARKRTGKGQYVDVAGREAVACHIGDVIMDCIMNDRERVRAGNDHPSAAPHGCFRCSGDDEWVTIAVETDTQWQGFCKCMGSPAWTREDRFGDGRGRWENRRELHRYVEEWTVGHDHHEIMEILRTSGVPVGAVFSAKELHRDPHLRDRGFFKVVDHGEGVGKRPIPAQLPAHFSTIRPCAPKRAPRFAEDNEYVFSGLLGMSKDEIKRLEEEKVAGTPSIQARPTRTGLIEEQQSGWFDPDYLPGLREVFGEDIGGVSE